MSLPYVKGIVRTQSAGVAPSAPAALPVSIGVAAAPIRYGPARRGRNAGPFDS